MHIQEHYSKVRLQNKVYVEMNKGCIVQCNTQSTMVHGVEWHRLWNSKIQKQCDTSQHSMTQHETRSDRAVQNRTEQNTTQQRKTAHDVRQKQGRARGYGSKQPFFLSTLVLNTPCTSKQPALVLVGMALERWCTGSHMEDQMQMQLWT